MIYKKAGPSFKELLPGLILLALGVAIGATWNPINWWKNRNFVVQTKGEVLSPPRHFKRDLSLLELPDNQLETVRINLSDKDAARLELVQSQAMQRGVIVQDEDDMVGARIGLIKANHEAEVRIKGDWTDHVKTPKWSLRVKLKDGKLLGMRTFSLQSPNVRGYLWEWALQEIARREGLLAPRSTFVNLVVNNRYHGIFFLEEHFAKELLESQGRREGPIVIFDETTMWATYFQNHIGALGFNPKVPAYVAKAQQPEIAGIRAYGEGRLSSMEGLNKALISGLDKLAGLQRQLAAANQGESHMRRLVALREAEGETVARLLDTEAFANTHALLSIFQVWHGLVWHNMRFYYNPVSDRLEPIVYDNMAHAVRSNDPVIFRPNKVVARLATNQHYYNGFFKHLGRYASGSWLERMEEALAPDLARFTTALDGEATLPAPFRPERIWQRLRTQQVYLQEVLSVRDPINFSCRLERASATSLVDGQLHVRAWSTTAVPTVLEGFRFYDGTMVSARSILSDNPGKPAVLENGSVVLPHDQRPLQFVFPVNRRLANLSNVAEIKHAIRAGADKSDGLRLDEIVAVYSVMGRNEQITERLHFRVTNEVQQEGRPELPTLGEVLAQHDFLGYNVDTDRLYVKAGTHLVKGDLLVPRGYPLHAAAGVVLRFGRENLLYSESALLFKGQPNKQVVIEPAPGEPFFSGVLVRRCATRSDWKHVTVRKTNSLSRAGWATTGGITFYHAPVTMTDSRIEGTLAEDGTNIFGTDFLMERVTFDSCVSDSFDGDFVTGTVRQCTFVDGAADGVDFSGSNVRVEQCRFLRLGDKAVSVGENTRCVIEGGEVIDTSIGVASKDLSTTTISGTSFADVRGFIFAVYTKKAEFGPASVEASALVLKGAPAKPYLVQTGSSLSVDGTLVATEAVDVERLYHEKVLGN